MLRRASYPLFVVALVTLAIISQVGRSTVVHAGTADHSVSPAVAHAAASTSLTGKAVTAADAFKASLSSAQQSTLQFAFDSSSKKAGWSNLPTTLVKRVGIKVGDLTAAQKAKLTTLLKTMLSSTGYSDEEATRKADTYLSQNGGGSSYGEGLYYVAFYGTPSTSKKWTVQFGGHHYAIHMTYSGSTISNTPYFVGVEPKAAFTLNGKSYQPMKDEAKYLFGAVQALTTTQKAAAKLSQSFDDVLVGPQKDGSFPTRQGVTVSTLSSSQQSLVTKAIKAYLGDLPSSVATARLAVYKGQYAKTKLAYSGTADGNTSGGYVRIDGPRVWIEIATQNGIIFRSTTHYHSIERDHKTDYGAGT